MTEKMRYLKFAGLGLCAGLALLIVAAASPQGIQGVLVQVLITPVYFLNIFGLDSLYANPAYTDEQGFGILLLITAIIWPVIGAIAGALIAYFTDRNTT